MEFIKCKNKMIFSVLTKKWFLTVHFHKCLGKPRYFYSEEVLTHFILLGFVTIMYSRGNK